jgi:hypothetical protein
VALDPLISAIRHELRLCELTIVGTRSLRPHSSTVA